MTSVLGIRETLAEGCRPPAAPIPFSYISATVASPFYVFLGGISVPFVRGLYRLRVAGVEHLPRRGGFVLAANHTSNFDPWPLGLPLWPDRQLRFMAKSELFNPVLKPLIVAGGGLHGGRGRKGARGAEAGKRACPAGRGGGGG